MTIPQWTLTDRLTKAREYAGLTQKQLAQRLDVGEKTVWRAEKGVPGTQRTTLLAWAVACGVDVDWLINGTEGGDAVTGAPTLWQQRAIPGQLSIPLAA